MEIESGAFVVQFKFITFLDFEPTTLRSWSAHFTTMLLSHLFTVLQKAEKHTGVLLYWFQTRFPITDMAQIQNVYIDQSRIKLAMMKFHSRHLKGDIDIACHLNPCNAPDCSQSGLNGGISPSSFWISLPLLASFVEHNDPSTSEPQLQR